MGYRRTNSHCGSKSINDRIFTRYFSLAYIRVLSSILTPTDIADILVINLSLIHIQSRAKPFMTQK